MHLRSLTLRGFKSFPDRTRLEFAPGISVVVGPNGSGKSNITDAVLWALGEQSPLAVRGGSMQDVIFAGAHGVAARSAAEVEVVIDNSDGRVDLPMSEIAITRRLDRDGDAEYRINGARARLSDVIEILSDTGLGKEMHSVVSQGRVAEIVTSKPRDRRMLIEEAAGLGKHRRRRRRAQLKLTRTQENLDRALDVEREARGRLKPLKRQAEAAELHERLQRQSDEARWALARDGLREGTAGLAEAQAAVAAAREALREVEIGLGAVRVERERAEARLAARGSEQQALSARLYAARTAADRVAGRIEHAADSARRVQERVAHREALVADLERRTAEDVPDEEAAGRIAALEADLAGLTEDRRVRLERELARLEEERVVAAARLAEASAAAEAAAAIRRAAEADVETARRERREREKAAEGARRDAARLGAELAGVNQFLRAQAGAPGGARALADGLSAEEGYELALVSALGSRLRAAIAADLGEARTLLGRTGRDGGAALVVSVAEGPSRPSPAVPAAGDPPTPDAEPLLDHLRSAGDPAALGLARRLLADTWVVASLDGLLAPGFIGVAVTRDGQVWAPAVGELRRVPPGGEDRVLAQRNRRDALIGEVERLAKAEQDALAHVEQASGAVQAADAARDEADGHARAASRDRDEAREAERHIVNLARRRRNAPDDESTVERRRQLTAAIGAERRLLEAAERERVGRAERLRHETERLAYDRTLVPAIAALRATLDEAAAAVAQRREVAEAELAADREVGERLAAELRACATKEAQVQDGLRARHEAVTAAEIRAQRARDVVREATEELAGLVERLGLEAGPAETALTVTEREELRSRIARLAERREQLGPVNPLAQDEYADALAHVEELESQRGDLETALRELQGLIRDTDRRIRQAFDETFEAASKNFEEVVEQLFPGGRGRLRLVREDAGPRAVADGEGGSDAEEGPEDSLERAADAELSEQDALSRDERTGVEIEITPAGKATKRLSLLSGGEKTMTALAFLFAVFLAKPCPFYILDEVEAALDDMNVDRFLGLLRRFSDRAQFIVVTHQKRTMEAADALYGVSMAGNGVSKVISRRLPPRVVAPDAA